MFYTAFCARLVSVKHTPNQPERRSAMDSQETHGTIYPAEPVQDARPAVFDPFRPTDHHQDRPLVGAFDPYFSSPSSGSRDFDEMMWERAA